jgi:formylglycine-generating enzyme required for sulfatase activity
MSGQAEHDYDLFVSYAEADYDWLERYLFKALERAGIRYHSEEAFELGRPRLIEFERAIQHSQRTLLVLSPAYLTESFSQFASLLAQSYDLEHATWSVIPFVLHPVQLPPRLAMLKKLDGTDSDKWEEVVAKLCQMLQHPMPSDVPKPPCPYPGMAPFRAQDARFFFGREREIRELQRRLRHQNFMLVIGPSGSGKSSLLFAGLVPELQESQPDAWVIKDLRPGGRPVEVLAQTLGIDRAPDVEWTLAIETVLARQTGIHRLLLVVDQLEEMFALASKDAQTAFVTALRSLRQDPRCVLVLTMRADFYAELMNSDLWPVDVSQRFEVSPLRGEALREAIVSPAEACGVYIEERLVERLVADAANEPGVLPLVQETMVLLWGEMERRLVTLSAYERLGAGNASGLAVAVAAKADSTLAGLSESQRAIARHIFLRLVQFGQGRADTRRQQRVAQLYAFRDDPVLFEQTLHYLADNRLLTLSGEAGERGRKVDIAHEVLISHWPRLRDWINEDRGGLLIHRRLTETAQEWEQHERNESYLYRGARLAETEGWGEAHWDVLNSLEREFLRASVALRDYEAQEEERRLQRELRAQRKSVTRLRWLVAILTLAALVAPVLWGYRQVLRTMARGPLVHILASQAVIGPDRNSANEDQKLSWRVALPAFDIERYEVTNRQYRLCVMARACTEPLYIERFEPADRSDHPVVGVSAFQAFDYCLWIGRRLPTELEWERAARGSEGRSWPWGEDPPDPTRLNILFEAGAIGDTRPVGSYPKGATPDDAIFDLAGNVWEWTSTDYQLTYPYQLGDGAWDGSLAGAPVQLVRRGGGWRSTMARPTLRSPAMPISQSKDAGFRCAHSSRQGVAPDEGR